MLCKLASETGFCNRLREGGGASVVYHKHQSALASVLFFSFLTTAASRATGQRPHCTTNTLSTYLRSPSHHFEEHWQSGTASNDAAGLSQDFAGMAMLPASSSRVFFSLDFFSAFFFVLLSFFDPLIFLSFCSIPLLRRSGRMDTETVRRRGDGGEIKAGRNKETQRQPGQETEPNCKDGVHSGSV